MTEPAHGPEAAQPDDSRQPDREQSTPEPPSVDEPLVVDESPVADEPSRPAVGSTADGPSRAAEEPVGEPVDARGTEPVAELADERVDERVDEPLDQESVAEPAVEPESAVEPPLPQPALPIAPPPATPPPAVPPTSPDSYAAQDRHPWPVARSSAEGPPPVAAPLPHQAVGPQSVGGARVEVTRLEKTVSRGLAKVTGAALGPYQTAIVRIGFALTWLCFLLREFPHRRELYGPDSPWSWELGDTLVGNNGAFTALLWSDSMSWFEIVYALAILASLGLLIGWRTRTMSVFFMIGVLSLQNRSVFMGDGGDNIIHLMALYLVLTRCGQVWSLDARRARRRAATQRQDSDLVGVALWSAVGVLLAALQLTGFAELSLLDNGVISEFGWFPGIGWAMVFWGLWLVYGLWWVAQHYAPGELRSLLDVLANLVHNATLLVILAEVCLVYSTAGWYKIQGSRWQDGTAVYYPMHLDYFAPFPSLSEALGNSGVMIMLATYGTVIIQVAFPFTLFNRRVKNVLLAVMILEHLSIAVLLGLPFFSMAMIAADAVFLPTVFLVWVGTSSGKLATRLRPGRQQGKQPPGGPMPAEPPGRAAGGSGQPDRTLVG